MLTGVHIHHCGITAAGPCGEEIQVGLSVLLHFSFLHLSFFICNMTGFGKLPKNPSTLTFSTFPMKSRMKFSSTRKMWSFAEGCMCAQKSWSHSGNLGYCLKENGFLGLNVIDFLGHCDARICWDLQHTWLPLAPTGYVLLKIKLQRFGSSKWMSTVHPGSPTECSYL